jgi:hypothetical protein
MDVKHNINKLLLKLGAETILIKKKSFVYRHFVSLFGLSDATAKVLILKFGIPISSTLISITSSQFFSLFIYFLEQLSVQKSSKRSITIFTAFTKVLSHKQLFQEAEDILFYSRYQRMRKHHYRGIRHA